MFSWIKRMLGFDRPPKKDEPDMVTATHLPAESRKIVPRELPPHYSTDLERCLQQKLADPRCRVANIELRTPLKRLQRRRRRHRIKVRRIAAESRRMNRCP